MTAYKACYFCGKPTARPYNWSHWIVVPGENEFNGHYIRVDYCEDCRDKIVRYKAPAKPKVAKKPTQVGGDWALVGKFLGATKGKKSR